MKTIGILILSVSLAALGALTSCTSATSSKSDSAATTTGTETTTTPTTPTTTSSPVYDLAFTYTKSLDTQPKHPALTFQVKPAYGLAITQAKITYAVNAAAVSGGLDAGGWVFNTAAWAKAWSAGTNDAIVAGTWVTALLTASDISAAYTSTTSNSAGTSTTVTSVGGDVELALWSSWSNWADIADGHVYIKKIELTYSDATTETVTFDQTGWTTDGANLWRLGQFSANNTGTDAGVASLAASVTTVAF